MQNDQIASSGTALIAGRIGSMNRQLSALLISDFTHGKGFLPQNCDKYAPRLTCGNFNSVTLPQAEYTNVCTSVTVMHWSEFP